eukprot:3053099-Prymnesium_polylepis.1
MRNFSWLSSRAFRPRAIFCSVMACAHARGKAQAQADGSGPRSRRRVQAARPRSAAAGWRTAFSSADDIAWTVVIALTWHGSARTAPPGRRAAPRAAVQDSAHTRAPPYALL